MKKAWKCFTVLFLLLTTVAFGQPLFHITDSLYLDYDDSKHPAYNSYLERYPMYNEVLSEGLFPDIGWQQNNYRTRDFLKRMVNGKPEGTITTWGVVHYIADSLIYGDSLGFNDSRISFVGDWTFGANCQCAFAKPPSKMIFEYSGMIEVYAENDPGHGAILFNGDTVVLNGPHRDGVFIGNAEGSVEIEIIEWPVGWDYFAFEYIKVYDTQKDVDLPLWAWIVILVSIAGISIYFIVRK